MATSQFELLHSYLEFCYPKSFPEIKERNLISENLFSPFNLELPKTILQQVQTFVEKVYQIKESENYQQTLPLPENFMGWPKTPSLLTCFDFHYSPEMGLKLIEINTNASLYLPIILQRCAQADHCVPPQFDSLLQSFVESFDLKSGDEISVLDEEPSKEGLYFEFLIFKEWLTQKGYPTNIISLKDYPTQAKDNIYNRYTDFYFAEDKSKAPCRDYFESNKRFSPNPREYFLLADKKRLSPLKNTLANLDPELAKIIPETKLFSEFASKEDLWAQRKKYFLKPSQSFGSKGVFSGKGISRKAFDNLYDPNFIAQEICPAGRRKFKYEEAELEMKFDLRFFTFNGKVDNYGARLYQGQTTNMRTPLGGITPIIFI